MHYRTRFIAKVGEEKAAILHVVLINDNLSNHGKQQETVSYSPIYPHSSELS
jgi:hypothetical protein